MVISYVRRFLFIHIYKAAGMSVEQALWPHDVRAPLVGRAGPDQRAALASIGVGPDVVDLQRHANAKEIRAAAGEAFFARLFKFAFVRNPWDLQLSLYHFNLKHPEFPAHKDVAAFPNFEAFILAQDRKLRAKPQQLQFITDDDGRQLVDFIGRFETIDQDFKTICERVGIPNTKLAHVNRTDHLPWQRSYTPAMFEIVRDIHRADIDAFGYAADPKAYGFSP